MQRTQPHLPFLDVLRGIAIIAVFCFHSINATFGPTLHIDALPWKGMWKNFDVPASFLAVVPATFGSLGVAIFFVVSGFCIHLNHARSGEKCFGIFFIRRFFRIYPPYFVALLFFGFVFFSSRLHFGVSGPHRNIWPSIAQLVTHLLLLHNLFHKYHYGINSAFWSIGTEAQLYLIYPLLLAYALRSGWRRALWLTALIEIFLRGFGSVYWFIDPTVELPRWLTASPFAYWFSWSMGAAVAEAFLQGEPLPFRKLSPWLAFLFLLVGFIWRPAGKFEFMFAALLTATLIVRLLQKTTAGLQPIGGAVGAISKPLRFVGVVSYSLYLLHQPLLDRVPVWTAQIAHNKALPSLLLYGSCLLSFFPILGISYLFHRWVELPSIAWGKGIVQRKRLQRGSVQT